MSVVANNRDIAGEASGHQVIYMNPSICITPAAPSPVPIPYVIMTPTGTQSLKDQTEKVKMGGKGVLCIGSLVATCNGNEPGSQKETASFKTGSSMFVLDGSMNVKFEGCGVAYTGSSGMGNKM